MDKDFESELKGTLEQATNAKQQIKKYFKRYGDSGHQDAKKHQLMFASKVISNITKCSEKHLDIYYNIITKIFGDQLKPESGLKYWTLYVNCTRYFHYQLVNKKEYKMSSAIYVHISSYVTKLQSAEIANTLVNIYCYQLFLQNSLISLNRETALNDANEMLDNLTKLFNEILDTNKHLNFQYPNILKNTMQWLFPRISVGAVCQFLNILNPDKVKRMFESLFALHGRQTVAEFTQEDVLIHANFIMEMLYTFLQVDLTNKLRLQLTVALLSHCRTECRLQSEKPIAEMFLLLYDFSKLLCAQEPTLDFQRIYTLRCERFKELFDRYSKDFISQPWFSDYIVFVYLLHSQLQNTQIFGCFWKQMFKADCFTAMFQLLIECIKLAAYLSSETKLFSTTCCTSTRKHVILSFGQIAIAGFVFYCQNVEPQDLNEDALLNTDDNFTDNYPQKIHKLLILITNHAVKLIDKMDCISSTSPEISVLLTRFKQAALSAKTNRQAGTCIAICELYFKIKTKIPSFEWPLLLRRLYKTVTQNVTITPNLGQEIQMCYIASMLDESIAQIDIGQIRAQINVYYASGSTAQTNEPQQHQLLHENCLMQLYQTTTCLFRPYLEPSRKKLLHWLESQHILKYHKSNNPLLRSLLKSSQSQYDFVIITKAAKLQTYALAKISSLYKALSTKAQELGRLRRLEQLTFGHCCLILLNEQFSNQKIIIESKDLNEDQLEKLLLRKEMRSFTIKNELKRFQLALEAFKAFEEFYEKFDNELISFDDAIIDWESIIDDLTFLAQYLQLSGYMEYCLQVWLLHYKCARLIQDDFAALKSLTFFCEHSEYLEKHSNTNFKLDIEIELHFPTIIAALEDLSAVQKSNQTQILLAVLQIAYYYARSLRYSFAQILLEYVEKKHSELPERQGRYDLVMVTMDAIKFRLMWRQFDENISPDQKGSLRCTAAERSLLQQCLLHEIEEMLDRFQEFQIISSSDAIKYSVLLVSLVQEFAECTANRLCDNFISAFFTVSSKLTLQYGLALRFVQVMSMWMWVNLQMEYVIKAETKLRLIEFVLGVKSIRELTENCAKAMIDIQSSTLISTISNDLISLNHNPGVEAIRKLAHVQLSPIKMDKLEISPSSRNSDLKRYFQCNIDMQLMPQNEQIEWTFFTVGCLNARLYFLVEDYDQLETFYEKGRKWLQMQKNTFNKHYYKNIHLMAMQHYINFLRSQRRYDKALQYLEYAMEVCDTVKFNIDVVYYINFQLQLVATRKEFEGFTSVARKIQNHNELRRALQYNDKFNGSSSGDSSSSVDTKSIKPKHKPKFKICEDSIEIIDSDDSMDEIVHCPAVGKQSKTTKRTKPIELNEPHKTPKIPRKINIKTPAAGTATTNKIKRPPPSKYQQHFYIDLSGSHTPSPTDLLNQILSSSNSSLDEVETEEKLNPSNDIVAQMKKLEIEVIKKPNGIETKPKSRARKLPTSDSTETYSTIIPSVDNDIVEVSKATRTRNRDKTPVAKPLVTAVTTRPRRQRKFVLENNENLLLPSTSSAALQSSRRTQKNTV